MDEQLEFHFDFDFSLPNWEPLAKHIGDHCGMWMWMYRKDGLEYYKHIETRQYLVLDAEGHEHKERT